MPLIKMDHSRDPKKDILEALDGSLHNMSLYGARVLVAIYIRPEKTQSGLYLPDKYTDEDKWQGKVGLVVKKGSITPDAKDEEFFGGKIPEVGEWIMFRPSSGFPISLATTGVTKDSAWECRILEDMRSIIATVSHPDDIW